MGVIKPRALLPFAPEVVGTYSCHGVEPGIRAGETSAKINQDRGCVCYPFGPDTEGGDVMALFCVFDGHGMSGERLSEWCTHEIISRLEANRDELAADPIACMKKEVRARSADAYT